MPSDPPPTSTIHFIYPHGDRISCPDAIGRKVAERLRRHVQVVLHPLNSPGRIVPNQGDILLGHPDAAAWTLFKRSMDHPGWARRLMIVPYVHDDYHQCAFIDRLIGRCDRLLAITGNYWFESVARSRYAHWQAKMVHCDLAIDRNDFPVLKHSFAPPGRRRLVYIGHDGWYKNLPYLSTLARLLPGTDIGWIGSDKRPLDGVRSEGRLDFREPAARTLVAGYDFLITTSSADANPTTILEAMAWGLLPVTTPQSGYVGWPGITNIPLNDPERAAAVITDLQHRPEEELLRLQAVNLEALDRHFTWDRFADQVLDAIRSRDCPPLGKQSLANRWFLRWAELSSPRSFVRYHALRRAFIRRFANRPK